MHPRLGRAPLGGLYRTSSVRHSGAAFGRLLRAVAEMGVTGSKLEKSLAENFPGEERFFGYENVRSRSPACVVD